MKITIINGSPAGYGKELDSYIDKLADSLAEKHECLRINLKEKEILKCTGCFGCWVKKPGECVFKDDSAGICESYILSDLVILASPVLKGFVSATLKSMQDKLIPLIHPDFEIHDGEVHHRARYGKYPKLSLLLHRDDDCDDEDIGIIRTIYERSAKTLKTSLEHLFLTETKASEVAHAISTV